MKIIDCFTFYNELKMLEMRLQEMYDFVDYFVLVEATKTYANNDKELYYENNKEKYAKYNDKIIHIIVDDMPNDNNAWLLEYHQRRCINRGVSQLELNNDDIIIVSDLDEIIDTDLIKNIKNKNINIENSIHYSIEQDLYYYNLNTKFNHKWFGSKLLNYYTYYNNFNTDSNTIRNTHTNNTLKNGGWHFSYFGDVEFIKNKIKNFAHQEYNNDTYLNDEKILNNIKNSKDIYNRNECQFSHINIEDNTYLPRNYKFLM